MPFHLGFHPNPAANSIAASHLRSLSTSFSSQNSGLGKSSRLESSILSIKRAQFNARTGLDDVLAGLADMSLATPITIPKHDSYYSSCMSRRLRPKKNIPVPAEVALLVDAIRNADATEAWTLFDWAHTEGLDSLRNISRQQWSQLFFLVSRASPNAWENWKRTELVSNVMIQLKVELTGKEYATLMKVASRARLGDAVQEIWNKVMRSNIPRSLELWNNYLRASCNADERLWHRKFNGTRPKILEPATIKDPLSIISSILEDGLSPNTTTYELVILSLGHRGDADYAASIISSVWGIKLENAPLDDDIPSPVSQGSIVYPRISTLVSIINAYGSSDKLVEGLKLMEKMQSLYKIQISGDYALPLWENVMKWAFFSSEPWGNTPGITLDAIWTSIVDRHQLKPNGRMFSYKARRELALRNYNGLLDLIPQVMSSRNVKAKTVQASSILMLAAKGLANIGSLEACHTALDTWAPMGLPFEQVREKMQKYIATSPRVGQHDPTVLTIAQLGQSSHSTESTQPVIDDTENWAEPTAHLRLSLA